MIRSWGVVLGLIGLAVGCAQVPHSQLDLSLEARPAAFAERVDRFEVRIWAGRYETALEPVVSPAGVDLTMPAFVPLVPADDDASKTFTAEAEIFEGTASLGTQRVIGRFVQNERRVLTLIFRAECAAVVCGVDERCGEGGTCEPACFEDRAGEVVSVPCEPEPPEASGPCVVCDGDACQPRPDSDHCFDAVRLGDTHGCATSAGRLFCWGSNAAGQLGLGAGRTAFVPTLVPAPVGDAWSLFEAGGDATCGVAEDELYCWGTTPTASGAGSEPTPASVDFVPSSGWAQLSLASGWLCGRHATGVSCRGASERSLSALELGADWRAVDTSASHGCGLDSTGRYRCWGRNNEGQGGTGSLVGRASPPDAPPQPDIEFTQLAVSGRHSCGITTGGFLLCWGENLDDQVGVDHPFFEPCASHACFVSPQQVAMTGWRSVAVGETHSCGIRGDGELFCWGNNRAGQLGVGTAAETTSTPTRVVSPDGSPWTEVAAAAEQTCALTDGGALYCWGNNAGGRLGVMPMSPTEVLMTPQRVLR